MAKSRLLRIPGLRGPDQASSQSQLPLWVLLTSSLPARPDTAKSRKTVGREIQNDVALACGGFAVHFPQARQCPGTLCIAPSRTDSREYGEKAPAFQPLRNIAGRLPPQSAPGILRHSLR
jgi:hypothetical protein